MQSDEQELERLLAMLGNVAASLSAEAPEREALAKAMLALVTVFATEGRQDLEESYAEVGGKKPSSTSDLLFALSNPDIWAKAIEEFPELKRQILRSDHPRGSAGEFIREAVAEAGKRNAASNVSRFPNPDKPGGG